jgi:hypothetical protein
LPIWVLLITLLLPFLISKILKFYFSKSKFKKGDIVTIKGSSTPYFVIGYAILNKSVLEIRHFEKDAIFYHESFLEIV